MSNSIIAYSPCSKCEKDKCNICELDMYRQGTLKKDKWISVEERLPKPYERVFVCTRVGYMNTDMLCENGLWLEHRLFKVTHWMPIPQPPQMKADTLIEGKQAFLYVSKWLKLLPVTEDVVPRAEVDKIFDEIITRLLSYSTPTFNDKNNPIIELNTDIYDSINELKKKYIGE